MSRRDGDARLIASPRRRGRGVAAPEGRPRGSPPVQEWVGAGAQRRVERHVLKPRAQDGGALGRLVRPRQHQEPETTERSPKCPGVTPLASKTSAAPECQPPVRPRRQVDKEAVTWAGSAGSRSRRGPDGPGASEAQGVEEAKWSSAAGSGLRPATRSETPLPSSAPLLEVSASGRSFGRR